MKENTLAFEKVVNAVMEVGCNSRVKHKQIFMALQELIDAATEPLKQRIETLERVIDQRDVAKST